MDIFLQDPKDTFVPAWLMAESTSGVEAFHRTLPGYAPSPLVELPALARRMGIGRLFVKDESSRFGLKAFKGLGAGYAVARMAADRLGILSARENDAETPLDFAALTTPEAREKLKDLVFVSATDGNHGKSVAWAAGLLGCRSHILMPKGTVQARIDAVRCAGLAEVTVTEGNYDATVRQAKELADALGGILVQDTSWYGYDLEPRLVTQGYSTLAREAVSGMTPHGARPTHVFLQAGVGSMAGGVAATIAELMGGSSPRFIVTEAEGSACLLASARAGDGRAHTVEETEDTIMAGLNCGTPCGLVWPYLRDAASAFIACPDAVSAHGMRLYAQPQEGDATITSGESGAVTLGLLDVLCSSPRYAKLRRILGLDETATVLLFSTEGDTDPENWDAVVNHDAIPMPEDGKI